MRKEFRVPNREFWLFTYGSLMWDPCFRYAERRRAAIDGYHRALCIYSWVYRGTEHKPGLVFGLDRGGIAHGVAYRIRGRDSRRVHADVFAREMPTAVYHPMWLKCRLPHDPRRIVQALTFVADRNHAQYAGRHTFHETTQLVRQGVGNAGPCVDYVVNTVCHMRAMGIRDAALERLVASLAP